MYVYCNFICLPRLTLGRDTKFMTNNKYLPIFACPIQKEKQKMLFPANETTRVTKIKISNFPVKTLFGRNKQTSSYIWPTFDFHLTFIWLLRFNLIDSHFSFVFFSVWTTAIFISLSFIWYDASQESVLFNRSANKSIGCWTCSVDENCA